MDAPPSFRGAVPRLRATPERRRAMVGLWELEGQRILMLADPDTGALMARDNQGRKVNPIRLVTRGVKLEEKKREAS